MNQYNQARILGEKIQSPALVSKELNEPDFNSMTILLHNESPEKNELISRELKASGNSENRKIGEILEVFSRAEITKDEQKTIIQIKLPENSYFQNGTYAELLKKFYPDDKRENDKYKFSNFGEKLVSDASRQAIATFKQLEQAHSVFQFSTDRAKINKAFTKLDREAAALNKVRTDYNRSEKPALLREGIKTDIADLLKKNPGVKENKFVEQTSKVLTQNLEKVGVFLKSSDNMQVEKLSREIINRIEAKQNWGINEFAGFNHSQTTANQAQTKVNTTPKIEKIKDLFVLAR